LSSDDSGITRIDKPNSMSTSAPAAAPVVRAPVKRRRVIVTSEAAAAVLQAVWRGRVQRQVCACVHARCGGDGTRTQIFKRIMYRTRVAREILVTERTYISNLKTIKFVYMMPGLMRVRVRLCVH
jgi:hypothetical protein